MRVLVALMVFIWSVLESSNDSASYVCLYVEGAASIGVRIAGNVWGDGHRWGRFGVLEWQDQTGFCEIVTLRWLR